MNTNPIKPVREAIKEIDQVRHRYQYDAMVDSFLMENGYPIIELPPSVDKSAYELFLTLSAMIAWCQANCGEENFATINARKWAFSKNEDAIAFKLAWYK